MCFSKLKSCRSFRPDDCLSYDITPSTAGFWLPHYAHSQPIKVIHASYQEDFVEVPTPFYQGSCQWGYRLLRLRIPSFGQISFKFSSKLPVCANDECQNGGTCKSLLDSNQWFCKCRDGYHGDTCENQMDMRPSETETLFPPIGTLGD